MFFESALGENAIKNYHVIGVLLDKLVENLAAVGLQLNAQKTKVLTTQARPPSQLQTPNGLTISVLDRESSNKWLGCMLTTSTVRTTTCDVECRLQAAAKTFNANRWILCDPKVSIAQKIEYFDRIISPIACFAAGHRTVYRNDLHKMDVAYRRLLRSVVGPPRNMDWMIGHCHGMKFFTFGMNAFGCLLGRQHPKHVRNFVYDTIGMWHNISQHCLGIVGSKKYYPGNQQGINALAGQNTVGILCSPISVS